jgi:hypothetical protein
MRLGAPIAARPLPPEAIALSEATAKRLKVNCVPFSGPAALSEGASPRERAAAFASGTGR